VQKAEEQSTRELPAVEQPAGIPPAYDDHAKLMYDLLTLAFQCDLTRVGTYLCCREQSGRTYPDIGVHDPHHSVSHHQGRADMLEQLVMVNHSHVQLFSLCLERLASLADGEGSLLDLSVVVYGAGFGDPDIHDHHDIPLLIAGNALGPIGGRHLRLPRETPL